MNLADSSITDIIQTVFALAGGIYGLYLFKQSIREKRNQVLIEIFNRLYCDNEIRKIIYAVDTGKDVSEIKFQGKLEKEIDKTLRFLDFIGHLIKDKSIRKKDIDTFRYEIGRILENEEVIKYIKWMKTIGVSLENLEYCPQQGLKFSYN